MKNVIYAGTNTSAVVNANDTIQLTQTVRKFNRCGANSLVDRTLTGINILTNGKGCTPRYNGVVSITFTAPAAGDVIFTLYQNGVAVPFATATESITTAGTETATMSFPFSILANIGTNTLTIVNTGTIAATIVNASILVQEN